MRVISRLYLEKINLRVCVIVLLGKVVIYMGENSEKTIVFLINTLQVGGAAKILKFVVEKSKHLFKKVYVITLDDDEQMQLGDNVIHLDNRISNGSKMMKGLWRVRAVRDIRKVMREIQPDVACAFISDVAVTARLATLGQKLTFVSAERGDPFTLPKIWKYLVKWTYESSDYCVFQTDMARDFFDKMVVNKSFVIPNPYLGVKDVMPYYGERRNTIVGVGRFSQEKRFDLLIRSFAEVHKKHPEYSLILYGDGQQRQLYEDLIEELCIRNFVSLPGYVDNIPVKIREEGIFVLSSQYEGIPNVLIEAMSMGLPTIATDCTPGGPRFLTNNGRRGILIPVGDLKAMVNAINTLIENTKLAKNYSDRAKEIIPLLDSDIIAKKWVEMINFIAKKD